MSEEFMPDRLSDLLFELARAKGLEQARDTTRLIRQLPELGVVTHRDSPYVHVAIAMPGELRPELAIMTERHQVVAWLNVRTWQDQALITVRPTWPATTTVCEVLERQTNRTFTFHPA